MHKININYDDEWLIRLKRLVNRHKFKEVLEAIDEYLSNTKNCMYLELLEVYIDCQIKLGLFDEAIRNVEVMYKYFLAPNYYDLALKYAVCLQTDKLKEVLANNEFSVKQYYEIGKYCLNNDNVDLAEELFRKVSVSSDPEYSELALRKLEIINIYKEHGDKVFREQTYRCFKYRKNTLLPGDVIMTSCLRDDYPENIGYKKVNWPYMVWRVEGKRVYAFPIVEGQGRFLHVFSKDNYPGRQDRCNKDRLVCIHEDDIVNVIDKITDEDYQKAIESLQINICFNQKGKWKPEVSCFMNSFIKDREVQVGNIVVTCDTNRSWINFYFVFDVDDDGYKVYKVGNTFLPITDDIEVEYISREQSLITIIEMTDLEKKQLLLSFAPSSDVIKRVLRKEEAES